MHYSPPVMVFGNIRQAQLEDFQIITEGYYQP
jgi:hypothetical protein